LALTISAIVCAYNEARHLPACLFSLLAQTRPPDEILVVNNASTDETAAVARAVPGIRVVNEPTKGLVVARETARRQATGDVLAFMDADCRAPIFWIERVERRFHRSDTLVGVTGPYRFYDWDRSGRALLGAYDALVAPPTHFLVHHAFHVGALLYGGNFAVRSCALARIDGFDRTIEFHGEDTNLRRQQRFPQTEASLFVENAPAVREELGRDRPNAAIEHRCRADVVPEWFVFRMRADQDGRRSVTGEE
jgi:glycosyltransferase involved in cell wall biosynthesis